MNKAVSFKFLLVGDGTVGKTSLVRRLCRNIYSDSTEETVGVEFMPYSLTIDNTPVKLQIWDTAGQEQYRSLGRAYYRDAVGVLLVFAVDNHNSFESLEHWLTDVRDLCNPHAKIVVVASKCDLVEERKVTKSEIESFVESFELKYVETSAKENINVIEVFDTLARSVLDAVQLNEIQLKDANNTKKVSETKAEEKKSGCC